MFIVNQLKIKKFNLFVNDWLKFYLFILFSIDIYYFVSIKVLKN